MTLACDIQVSVGCSGTLLRGLDGHAEPESESEGVEPRERAKRQAGWLRDDLGLDGHAPCAVSGNEEAAGKEEMNAGNEEMNAGNEEMSPITQDNPTRSTV